jgi:hypothetical protein
MLKLIDILGDNIYFTVDGKSTYKTSVGGIGTLFICILTVLATMSFGSDIIYHLKPLVLTQQIKNKDYPFKELNKFELFFRS